MKNKRLVTSYFGLPPAWRLALYFILFIIALFGGLRWIEHAMTYHPQGFVSGAAWQLPANGEEVWFANAQSERLPQGKRLPQERLHGWLVRATQQPARATVLHCHGNGGNLTHVRWFAEELARRGFDVLIWDYRGYGRSDGKLTDEWGLYADGDAAYAWLTKERGVKPENLIIYGQSLGSTVAIDLAARQPAAALVIESGLSSASAMATAALPWLPSWLHRIGKNRFESARKLASVKAPVFIAHGTADDVIPVAQSQTNYAVAREPKELLLIEGGDHNLFGRHHAEIIERMSAFVGRRASVK